MSILLFNALTAANAASVSANAAIHHQVHIKSVFIDVLFIISAILILICALLLIYIIIISIIDKLKK